MVRPSNASRSPWVSAEVWAATNIAGLSRNRPTLRWESSRESTSRSSSLSPAHFWRRNSLRPADGMSNAASSRPSTCFQRSGSIASSAIDLAVEPGARCAPVAHHCYRGNFEHLRTFLHTQSTEEAQLDHLRLSRINLRQSMHSLVKCHEIFITGGADDSRILQFDMLHASPAFLIVTASMID